MGETACRMGCENRTVVEGECPGAGRIKIETTIRNGSVLRDLEKKPALDAWEEGRKCEGVS